MRESRPKAAQENGVSDRLLRALALVAGGIVALLVALSLLQCSLKKPEAPSWDSTLRVPVASDRLTVANLISRLDDGNTWVNESGQIGLFWTDTLDTVSLAADLSLPTASSSLGQPLGRVAMSPRSDSARLAFSDHYGGPAGSIPPVTVTDQDTLGPLPGFTWIAPGAGEAYLRIDNQVGLDFDSVSVSLSDPNYGFVGSYDFGGLAAGATDSVPLGLTARRWSNRLAYDLYAHTQGGTLLSLSNSYLELSLRFGSGVALDSGLLEVPQVTLSESQALGFSGNADIVSVEAAHLSSGQLTFVVDNETGLAAAVTITVPAFTQSGSPLTRHLAVGPNASISAPVNLAGYDFQPDGQAAPQYFDVQVVAQTVATSPAQVRVLHTDSVSVTALVSGLSAASLTGVLAPRPVALPAYQRDVDAPSEWGAFHADEASLSVELVNGSGAFAQVQLTLDNGSENRVVSGPMAAGSPQSPQVSALSDLQLAALFDPYPAWLHVSGQAVFGDSVTSVTLTPHDFALARVNISSPLAVRIDSVSISGDAERLDIEGTDVPDLVDVLQSGMLHADLGNHLPVAAQVTFFAALDSAGVYAAPDLVLGPVTVAAGRIQVPGIVSDTSRTLAALPLDKDDLELFTHGRLYVGYSVHLPGSAGQVVRFSAADYLQVTSWFDLVMRNGETW